MCNANPQRAALLKLVANSVSGVTPGFTPEINSTLEFKDGWMVPSAKKKKKILTSQLRASF